MKTDFAQDIENLLAAYKHHPRRWETLFAISAIVTAGSFTLKAGYSAVLAVFALGLFPAIFVAFTKSPVAFALRAADIKKLLLSNMLSILGAISLGWYFYCTINTFFLRITVSAVVALASLFSLTIISILNITALLSLVFGVTAAGPENRQATGFIKGIHFYKYEILLFLFLLFELIASLPPPEHMHRWVTAHYLLSYRFGFSSRFLMGSVVSLLTDHVSAEFIWSFALGAVFALCFLVASMCARVIKTQRERHRQSIIAVLVMFLLSPASVTYLFNSTNYGRLDTYLLLCTLLIILLCETAYIWLVPVLCFAGFAIHQGFAFTYFPAVIVVLLLGLCRGEGKKKRIAITAITVGVSACAFIYFQFFSKNALTESYEGIINAMSQHSRVKFSPDMVRYEYFKSLPEQFTAFVLPDLWIKVKRTLSVLVLLSPLYAAIFGFWKTNIQNCPDRVRKAVFVLAMLSPLCALPAFALTAGWGRWLAAVTISQMCIVLYATHTGTAQAVDGCEAWYDFFNKHRYIYTAILIVYTAAGNLKADYII